MNVQLLCIIKNTEIQNRILSHFVSIFLLYHAAGVEEQFENFNEVDEISEPVQTLSLTLSPDFVRYLDSEPSIIIEKLFYFIGWTGALNEKAVVAVDCWKLLYSSVGDDYNSPEVESSYFIRFTSGLFRFGAIFAIILNYLNALLAVDSFSFCIASLAFSSYVYQWVSSSSAIS